MTSFRQFEANRRNAQKSTGPRSENGKQRASRNAVRHGLTAETVVEPIEDTEDYKAFEEAIASHYDAESPVERELVLRLSSLLWRLRRATSIETGFLRIEEEIIDDGQGTLQIQTGPGVNTSRTVVQLGEPALYMKADKSWRGDDGGLRKQPGTDTAAAAADTQFVLAQRFLRLANLDNGLFEKLGRYETALWRQVRQILFTLNGLRDPRFNASYRQRHQWRRTQPD